MFLIFYSWDSKDICGLKLLSLKKYRYNFKVILIIIINCWYLFSRSRGIFYFYLYTLIIVENFYCVQEGGCVCV